VNALSWAAIAEQLRALGVDVPVTGTTGSDYPPARSAPPRQADVPPEPAPCPADAPASTTAIVAAAKKAGAIFMERVSDGELIVEGLDRLPPDDRQKLEAGWSDIRNLLLPNDTSTASIDLLTDVGIELIYIDDEERAASDVQRICAAASTIGLDIETAPLPQYLPKAWPIAVTKDGRRSKLQTKMDTSLGLDPFRAEVRLLQIAAEIDGKTVALVIDLRRVPLGSHALAPLWR
jgi:hypothetical protein